MSEWEETQAEFYMQECFDLAKSALGRTSPNPIVGAIVLDKNNDPVGKGFHQKSGEDHAEVIALKEAGDSSKGGTLIVNLEPCCHYGKTPPCTDLIIKSGIKEVIFSNYDPNELVDHKGEKILKENNINVISGVLENEGNEINKFFFKWCKTKMPWVTLKQAQTLDGKVGMLNKGNIKITGKESDNEVHKLRNEFDAVMVGANTVIRDNPYLTVRNIEGRNPIRIILDTNLKTNPESNVYNNEAPTILITSDDVDGNRTNRYKSKNSNLKVIAISKDNNDKLNLKKVFEELGKNNILSVLVEAGPSLSSNLISDNLIDEFIIFTSPKFLGETNTISSMKLETNKINSQSYNLRVYNHKVIGNDFMITLRNN